MGGEDQQERLSRTQDSEKSSHTGRVWKVTEQSKYFLGGFIEGEGSLTVSVKHHPTSKFGFLVDPEFYLYQHESGRSLLELAQQTFQCGRIDPKSGSPRVLTYGITARRSIQEKVLPFFERYVVPFSCKAATFECFREICEMMNRKEHLTAEGLVHIVEKAYVMNPHSKGRQRLRTLEQVRERILRGHTPDVPTEIKIDLADEDMVQCS